MKNIKDELQHIILGDEPSGQGSAPKKTQTFLRGYAETSRDTQKQQCVKSKETEAILAFANCRFLFLFRTRRHIKITENFLIY